MIICDLCGETKDCLQREIEGKEYDICRFRRCNCLVEDLKSSAMWKHLIGVAVLTTIAFVVRFAVFLPSLDIYIHDTYIVIVPREVGFWLLLAMATVWLILAASKISVTAVPDIGSIRGSYVNHDLSSCCGRHAL